jgi:polysaccharide deacetylase family protein (PEP-CTERM system associated)
MFKNIMSVDLEDYYCDLPFPTWNKYESRVVETTKTILDLFEKYNVYATFFTVGYIAEKDPELIEQVRSKGHEISSHGYFHANAKNMTMENFEADLLKSLEVLRKVSGEKILGFRTPYFSINKQNFWAFDVIKKHLQYDSSVFPVKFHYGLSDAPTYIYRMSDEDPLTEDSNSKFIEIPMTTLKLPFIGNFPIAGGHYMRFLPYSFLRRGIEKFNKAGFPAIFYIHPKDLDLATPRIPGYQWHNYWGLNGAIKKFESLLKSFRFSSARDVISFY